MNEHDSDLDALDRFLEAHPPVGPPPGFARLVMQRVGNPVAARNIWHQGWVQWLAAGVGLALTLGRLFGYILSAWLAAEVSG